MKKTIIISLLLIFASCNTLRNNILQNGTLKQTNFVEQIPFNFENGLPLVTVNIEGINYNFLLDTGAPTVITPKLAKFLNLSLATNSKTGDSQGNVKKQDFVVIKNIQIGNINFENTGAAVIDLHQNLTMKCLNYDGIIGANLMSKAIWEIDYPNKSIKITDKKEKLDISKNAISIDFTTKIQKTPLVVIKIGNKIENKVTFDTGAKGNFNLTVSNFSTEIKNLKSIVQIGKSSTGIYGNGASNKTQFLKIQDLTLGNFNVKNQIVRFDENDTNLVGNDFFRFFKIVINWNENKIYMTKIIEFDSVKLEVFGFTTKFISNKCTVSSLYLNSQAEKAGIKLGDEILKVNEIDFKNLSENQICNFTLKGIFGNAEIAKVKILRDNNVLDFEVKKSILLD